nr:hypothetical protein HYE48_02845 [Mycoplasmopsis bovis]
MKTVSNIVGFKNEDQFITYLKELQFKHSVAMLHNKNVIFVGMWLKCS